MKKTLLLFLNLLFAIQAIAQIVPVKDSQSQDLFGYMFFSKIEQTDKNNFSYMATLLDINLNRISQAQFTDKKNIKVGRTLYNGNSIMFELIPEDSRIEMVETPKYSYRIFHLQSNSISPNFELPNAKKKEYVTDSYPIHGKGFGMIVREQKTGDNILYAVDDANQNLYSVKPFERLEKDKRFQVIKVGDVQNGLLAILIKTYPHRKAKTFTSSVLLIDATSGASVHEMVFNDPSYNVDLHNVQIIENEIFAFGDTYDPKHDLNSGKTSGMFKGVTDLNGNLISKTSAVWSDFEKHLDIEEGGFVRKTGYIYTHNYVLDKETNHTVVVGEYIKGSIKSVAVKDLIFLDFDENFKLHQVYEVETTRSVLSVQGFKFGSSRDYGSILKSHNYFRYRFSNQLEATGGLSFFYFNVSKIRLFGGNDYSRGLVVYKNKKFSDNKLTYTIAGLKDVHLNIYPAKPGFILVSERKEDQLTQNRLERLEY